MSKIYIGTNVLRKIYIGTTPVKSIYIGTTKVWQAPSSFSIQPNSENVQSEENDNENDE